MAGKEAPKKEEAQKIVTRYDRKVQRRKEADLKEKKQKQLDKLLGILLAAVIVIAIAAIPVNKYLASHATYITVGGHDITRVEYDYYFNLANSQYMNYLTSLGMSLDGQYSETMTWQDYFDRTTVDMIQQNKALADAAAAAGFTYDASAEFESFKDTVKESAISAGVSTSRYYRESFGRYASASSLRPYVEEGYLAAAYYEELTDSKAPSAAEIQEYYEANTATYDTVEYLVTEIAADVPQAQTVTNADGTTSTVEPEEAEVQAAMEAARAEAEAALETIDAEGTATTGLKSATNSLYRDWLFDDTRSEGDTTVIEDTTNNKYYALKFVSRYLDEDTTANIRVVMSSTVSCEDMLAELEGAGNTEEAFIALVEKYSEDTYSSQNGGMYEELSASYLDDEMSQWINEAGRKAGDIFSYTDAEGGQNYVLYYVSEGRPAWQVSIDSTLSSQAMNEYMTELKASYEVEDPKGNLNYLKVLEEQGLTEGTTESSTAQ